MSNTGLMIFTMTAIGFPIFVAHKVSDFSIMACVLLTIPIILVMDIVLVFIFYGTDGVTYILDTNNITEMWSRFIDATLCIEGWRHFPPN